MITLSPAGNLNEVLVLGAHCDDVEIGCGGALAALAHCRRQVRIHIVVFSGDRVRAPETRSAIARLLPDAAQYQIELHEFRDGFFPVEWPRIKEVFEDLRRRCKPQLVLTHYEHDRHQDHRAICELTWNTFRDQLVLEYEIPKFDGDLGRPSFYLPLTEEIAQRKLTTLLECFPSQAPKRWFTEDLFRSLMRLRGMECNAPSGLAEAFFARKIIGAW